MVNNDVNIVAVAAEEPHGKMFDKIILEFVYAGNNEPYGTVEARIHMPVPIQIPMQ